tara:strand:+ start:10376 stop:10906 length:531 start_codon:yes stop_codon:yes gene_type:complete
MFKLKRTNKTLIEVGFMLRKGLQDELKAQKHNATGKLSRGLKYHIKNNVLSIMSSVSYWKAVNNPLFAKIPNLNAIKSWLNAKRRNGSLVEPTGGSNANSILRRMKEDGYGRKVPYRFYEEGNRLPRRTDFAGYTANKFKDKIVQKLAPSIGKDVADMIAEQIKKNNPTINVQKAF